MQRNDASRREFIKALGAASLAMPFVGWTTGCGDKSNPPPPAGQQPGTTPTSTPTPTATAAGRCERNGTVAAISDPAHVLNVSREDVIAGTPKSYHIQGAANHDHVVALTAEDFSALQRDQSITVNSGLSIGPVGSHFHEVTVNCA